MDNNKREEWLVARSKGVGGSDAAAVLGLSPWRTPLQVYLEKRGEISPSPPSPAMRWGSLLEPLVINEYADQTGREVSVPKQILCHPTHQWMLGTIDGLTNDERLVEAKTARTAEGWGEPGTDEVPEHYLLQVQHYMAIVGYVVTDIPVLIGGNDFRIYTVPAEPEIQDILIEGERKFWDAVLAGIPPDPTTFAEAKLRFKKAIDKPIAATDDVVAALAHLADARKLLAEVECDEDRLLTKICGFMGEHDTLMVGDRVAATWKASKPVTRVDGKLLQKLHPDIYTAVSVTADPVRRFLLKE